tara:strand:- start:321 stop:530 length:210 start_codon:yes stop_codon:yes gene_type:complete
MNTSYEREQRANEEIDEQLEYERQRNNKEFIDEVFKTLYGDEYEYEYEVWPYNDALQKIKNLVKQTEGN